jgi:hypothetical protein
MIECPREADVVEAVAFDRLGEVQSHLDECATCAELVVVAMALRDDHRDACREAHVPSAGLVWWRATIRARADAARVAERPISVFEAIAAAAAIGLMVAVVGGAWSSLHSLERIGELVASVETGTSQLTSLSALILQHATPYVIALAVSALIAPVALYFARSDD